MQKKTRKPIAIVKATVTGDKMKIQRGKYDLEQFREGLKAELADKSNKSTTSCAIKDANLLDRVVQAHLNEGSEHSMQRLHADKTDKHEYDQDKKSALTQAAATASWKYG